MPNDFEIVSPMQNVPPEILLNIFFYLPAKDLIKSRRVCGRWKLIIDGVVRNSGTWVNFCKRELNSFLVDARRKVSKDFSWYNLYRSLSLWPHLAHAVEERDEFAPAGGTHEQVRRVEIVGDGRISVHKKNGIHYHSADSLKEYCHSFIPGDYARYTENDRVIVIQSFHLHLFVVRKFLQNVFEDYNATFDNVKLFLLTDNVLYFVTVTDELYIVNICHEPHTAVFILRTEQREAIMALGFMNGSLNILTYKQNIYSVENKKLVFKIKASSETNIANTLMKYNLLEPSDWRAVYQWMVLNRTYALIPDGPMRDVLLVRKYGEVFFVGTNFGVLLIYYQPFINGELDLFYSKPIRQVNFMERSDIPVLATCPIICIDACETESGHNVFVSMPKKVAVLRYSHNFMRPPSWDFEPYKEIHRD